HGEALFLRSLRRPAPGGERCLPGHHHGRSRRFGQSGGFDPAFYTLSFTARAATRWKGRPRPAGLLPRRFLPPRLPSRTRLPLNRRTGSGKVPVPASAPRPPEGPPPRRVEGAARRGLSSPL